jgi:hypothetical protein
MPPCCYWCCAGDTTGNTGGDVHPHLLLKGSQLVIRLLQGRLLLLHLGLQLQQAGEQRQLLLSWARILCI